MFKQEKLANLAGAGEVEIKKTNNNNSFRS
jgi:hypothetical protein